MAPPKITLWDDDAKRLIVLEKNLRVALRALSLEAAIQLNSEPPLLARHGLNGKTPAVQIADGPFWTHRVGQSISAEEFTTLLTALRQHKYF